MTKQLGRNARRRLTNHESTGLRIKVGPVPVGQCLLEFGSRDGATVVCIDSNKPGVDRWVYPWRTAPLGWAIPTWSVCVSGRGGEGGRGGGRNGEERRGEEGREGERGGEGRGEGRGGKGRGEGREGERGGEGRGEGRGGKGRGEGRGEGREGERGGEERRGEERGRRRRRMKETNVCSHPIKLADCWL